MPTDNVGLIRLIIVSQRMQMVPTKIYQLHEQSFVFNLHRKLNKEKSIEI